MLRRAPVAGESRGSVVVEPAADSLVASRAFPKFLSALGDREHITMIDVGPAIGRNLDFFAERFAFKIHVEDLYSLIESHARAGKRAELAKALSERMTQADASVDAVICWDIFDFLDKGSAPAFARELVRVLRPGGALFALFANAAGSKAEHYTKFVIEDATHFRHKHLPATPVQRLVLPNRDIIRLFDGLLVSDSYLLLTHTREIVFRKR